MELEFWYQTTGFYALRHMSNTTLLDKCQQ
uniref:Uncharacterized protein n=1 Tax=Siphoviridae sp. ctRlz6 TaxID=2823581 RepID=A0A8S5LDN7_9CAUD|nr:MAG TPA: hypothetical protein [Siphoviridae sp. ctRlz6]